MAYSCAARLSTLLTKNVPAEPNCITSSRIKTCAMQPAGAVYSSIISAAGPDQVLAGPRYFQKNPRLHNYNQIFLLGCTNMFINHYYATSNLHSGAAAATPVVIPDGDIGTAAGPHSTFISSSPVVHRRK